MSKRKTYYENQKERQQLRKQRPGMRHNDSLVAVNPERVTTLLELAIEHYGKKCARCGSAKALCVHHRHYRTVGLEKPERDIVLLCWNCHADLHTRGKEKRLTGDDVPFVDPNWAEWLVKIPNRPTPRSMTEEPPEIFYCAHFRDKEGQDWVLIESYCDGRDPHKEFLACVSMLEVVELVEFQEMGRLTWEEYDTCYVELSPGVQDLRCHPGWWKYKC